MSKDPWCENHAMDRTTSIAQPTCTAAYLDSEELVLLFCSDESSRIKNDFVRFAQCTMRLVPLTD